MALTWTVEVDANPNTAGRFVLNASLLGGTDTLDADENWVAVDATDVLSVSVRRGSSGSTASYDAGTATIVLDNLNGNYDPDNPYGRYTMGSTQLLHQGTGVRVKGNVSGTVVTVFTGRVESPQVGVDYYQPTVTFTCVDTLAALGAVDVPDQNDAKGIGDPSSVRAAWLLSQARIPASKQSIESGGRLCLGTTGGGSVRNALQQVAAGEAGRFFVSRGGLVTLTWHDTEYTRSVELVDDATVGNGSLFESLVTAPGVDWLVNAASVHRVPPRVRDPQTGQYTNGDELPLAGDVDYVSVERYGQRSVTVDVVLQDDADVASLATYLAHRRSTATTRLVKASTVLLEVLTDTQIQSVISLDLGSLMSVSTRTIDGRALMFAANVEGIQFDMTPGTTRATFVTAPSDNYSLFGSAGWFETDVSTLGGADVLAAY